MKKNASVVSILIPLLFFLFLLKNPVRAQLVEHFETGLPSSYSDVTTLQLASGLWTCSANQIAEADWLENSNNKCCKLMDQTGSELFSPVFTGGVGTLSISARALSTGRFQINVSKDNGITWTAIAGSPFTLSANSTDIAVTINDLFVNKVQFKRTLGTVLIDNVAITPCTQTKLNAGDLAILQLNEATTDRFSFITFVTLNAGTEILFTDNGFESSTTCRTGEGLIKYIAPSTIPAGTTISWYSGMDVSGTGWMTVPAPTIAISGTDQLFAFQGEWNKKFQMICGLSLSSWLNAGEASTTTSYLPDQLTNGVNAFAFTDNVKNAYYSGIKSAIKDILKSNINSSANWTTSSSDQGSQPMNFTFTNSHTISTSASLQNLNIYAGETVTVNPNVQLTVGAFVNNGTLSLLSDATGTATFIPATVSGTGTYSVSQYLPAGSRNWYVSSPVQSALVPVNVRYASYCEDGSNIDLGPLGSTAYWKFWAPGSAFNPGKGYVYSLVSPTDASTLEFSGALNHTNSTETMDIAVTRTEQSSSKGFNLVGNPYTAYLDWAAVKELAANADIESSIWMRTKNSLGYTFATYNCVGNQAVSNGASSVVSNLIPPMQAFWVRVKPNATNTTYATVLKLTSSMRSHCLAGNRLKSKTEVAQQLVRLVLSNGTGTDETLLYFRPDALNQVDDFDSPKYLNASSQMPDLYSVVGSEKLVINGMQSISIDKDICLGFSTPSKGLCNIQATEIQGLDTSNQLFIKDNVTGALFDLSNGTPYTFNSDGASSDSRFSILFRNVNSLSGSDELRAASEVNVFVDETGLIRIRVADGEYGGRVELFDSVGNLVWTGNMGTGYEIKPGLKAAGVYYVKVNIGGELIVRKVIVP